MAGKPRVLHQEPPTDAETRSGDVFDCPGCVATWALRYKHPREKLCLACGRELGRERKRAQRARARGEDAPPPPVPQHRAEDVAGEEVDRVVAQATRKRGTKKSQTGLMRR